MSQEAQRSDNKEFQASIAKMIESGQYFKDALEWYTQVYLTPATQRSFMVIVVVAIVFAALVTVESINNLMPLTERAPFVTWSRTTDDFYPELIKLSEKTENVEQMVARYFIGKYIEDRESYYPTNQDVQRLRYGRVLAQSAKRVRRNYEGVIHPSSAESFEQKYGRRFRRVVSNIEVNFAKSGKRLGEANVYFTTQVIPLGKKEGKAQRWKANVNFSMTDVQSVLEQSSPLRLLVRDYTLSEVSG